MALNKQFALVSLGFCLCAGIGVAQAEDIKTDDSLFLCGTTASRQTESMSQAYVHSYMLQGLPAAVSGEGVRTNREMALVTQTEPEEQDSVFNDPYNQFDDKQDEALPEPQIRQGDYPVMQYTSGTAKNLHASEALAYFGDAISGVMRPEVISQDNSFSIGFHAETKRCGGVTKYGFDLDYGRKLSDNLELQIGWSPLTWNKFNSGFDNGSVGLKYQIFKNQTNALGINAKVSFPTGSPTFSDVGLLPELKLSYSYYLPDKWSLTANVSSKCNTSTEHLPSYINVSYALQVAKAFEKDFVAINFGGKDRDALTNGISTHYIEAFYSRTLASDQSLSFTVRRGLTGGYRTDWKFSVGYGFTF